MRNPGTIAVVVAFIVVASPALAADPWQQYKPSDGSFTVLLPGMGKETLNRVPTKFGDLVLHGVMIELKDRAYGVSYNDFPPELIAAGKTDDFLDGAESGAAQNVDGKVRSSKKISLDGNPGREIVVDGKQGMMGRSRIYLVKNRLYQVMIAGENLPESADDAKQLFDSFKLIKN